MTTQTEHRATGSRTDAPRWYRPLIVWRLVVLAFFLAALVGSVIRRGIVLEGPVRWTMIVALLGAILLGAVALRGTLREVHSGRLAGFTADMLVAVVLGFIALNRMEMFTALDTVGERFNTNVSWLTIVVVGWLTTLLADRARDGAHLMRTVGRWTMGLGALILAVSMGLIPGLVEFVRRMVEPGVIGFAVGAAMAGVSARVLWSDAAAHFFGTTQAEDETLDGMLFVAPNVLGFLAFFAGPLIVSLFISFTDWDGLTDATFVGLGNYIDLFSDDLFLRSLRNIIVFGAIAIPLAVAPAMLLASLLNSKLRGMKVFRAVYFLPSIAGVVGVTLIWKQLFNSTVGFLNYMILRSTEFVNTVFNTNFEAAQPQWISDTNIALFATIIVFVWQMIGFNTVLYLAGMQGIDTALYEAAEIDGAGPWAKFRNVTIPQLQATTVFVVATTTILALQLFNEPFILQSPAPPAGPGNATLTPVVYLYQNAFQQFQIGYASAVAWVLFVLIFGISLVLYFRQNRDERLGKA